MSCVGVCGVCYVSVHTPTMYHYSAIPTSDVNDNIKSGVISCMYMCVIGCSLVIKFALKCLHF